MSHKCSERIYFIWKNNEFNKQINCKTSYISAIIDFLSILI